MLWGGRGDDTLDGGAGDDTLIGGPGADDLIGRPGVDTADYSSATRRGVNISLGTGAAWSDADGWPDDAMEDTFSSIENLVGTKFNDWLAADSGDNRIEGRCGNDWIFGGADEDTLLGGEGHDKLFPGGLATTFSTAGSAPTSCSGMQVMTCCTTATDPTASTADPASIRSRTPAQRLCET